MRNKQEILENTTPSQFEYRPIIELLADIRDVLVVIADK